MGRRSTSLFVGHVVGLLAFVIASLVPAGWMPSALPGAGFVICTAEGARTLASPTDPLSQRDSGQGEKDEGKGGPRAPCPFALSLAPVQPSAPFLAAPGLAWAPAPASPAPPSKPLAAPALRLDGARAPPDSA